MKAEEAKMAQRIFVYEFGEGEFVENHGLVNHISHQFFFPGMENRRVYLDIEEAL